ncbi:MAG: hypothetical protein ACYSWU_20085, partial [Planctomycetota bacterium]
NSNQYLQALIGSAGNTLASVDHNRKHESPKYFTLVLGPVNLPRKMAGERNVFRDAIWRRPCLGIRSP